MLPRLHLAVAVALALLPLARPAAATPAPAGVVPLEVRAADGAPLRRGLAVAFARDGGDVLLLTSAGLLEPERGWPEGAHVVLLAPGAPPVRARVLARGAAPSEDLAVLAATLPPGLRLAPLAPDDAPEEGEAVVVACPAPGGVAVVRGAVWSLERAPAEGPSAGPLGGFRVASGLRCPGGGGAVLTEEGAGALLGVLEGRRPSRLALGREGVLVPAAAAPPEPDRAVAAARIRAFLAARGLGRPAVPSGAEAMGGALRAPGLAGGAAAGPIGAPARDRPGQVGPMR